MEEDRSGGDTPTLRQLPCRRQRDSDVDAGRRKQDPGTWHEYPWRTEPHRAETIRCSTCHMTSTLPNDPAPAPLRTGIDWQLAPVDFIWFGNSGAEICAQLKDPKRNGGRDAVGLLEHLRHDASLSGFIPRGWEPGAGRTTPPGTFEDHVKDVARWGAAGQTCPN